MNIDLCDIRWPNLLLIQFEKCYVEQSCRLLNYMRSMVYERIMRVDNWRKDTDSVSSKYCDEIFFECHTDRYRSHMYWLEIEPRSTC